MNLFILSHLIPDRPVSIQFRRFDTNTDSLSEISVEFLDVKTSHKLEPLRLANYSVGPIAIPFRDGRLICTALGTIKGNGVFTVEEWT